MDSPGVQWIFHCLSRKHMHQSRCSVNAKNAAHAAFEKKSTETSQHLQLATYRNGFALAFVSQIKALCVPVVGLHEGSSYERRSQQAHPARFHQAEIPKYLDPKQALVRSALPEEETHSKVAENQQSQSKLCAPSHVPAMSNNSRFVYRIDTFRSISWEISVNTFTLL